MPRNGARMVIRDLSPGWVQEGQGDHVCAGLSPKGREKGQALHCD